MTAPNIATLPNGGGFPVDYNLLKPGTSTTVQDLYTFANDYGDYNVHWQRSGRHAERETEERTCIPGWDRPDAA